MVEKEDVGMNVEMENSEGWKGYGCVRMRGCEVKESGKWLEDKVKMMGLEGMKNMVDMRK